MNETLIANYNSKVRPNDTVYHIGDFAYGDGLKEPEKYFKRLNGKKHLIQGNHDIKNTLKLPWESVRGIDEITVGKQRIVLCHYAMRVWHHGYRGVWQLYGHVHGTLPETSSLTFDVGVDVWNYFPISFEEVKKKMEWKEKNPNHSAFMVKQVHEVLHNDNNQNKKMLAKLNADILSGKI